MDLPAPNAKIRGRINRNSANPYPRVIGETHDFVRLDNIIDSVRIEYTCLICNNQRITKFSIYRKMKTCDFCADYVRKRKEGQKLGVQEYKNIPNNIVAKELPVFNNQKVDWICKNNHIWKADYLSVVTNNCPYCFPNVAFINGIKISQQQLEIAYMLELDEKYVNVEILPNVFVDMFMPKLRICVEYDGWYWHKDKYDTEDVKRDKQLIEHGFSVLRIKSGTLLPAKNDLLKMCIKLENGSKYEEIVLNDWPF